MKTVLAVLQEAGLECLPGDRICLDPLVLAQQREVREAGVDRPFEHPHPSSGDIDVRRLASTTPPILHFFLDGSRRTYKIGDIILNHRYLPLVAGQVGVAVLARSQRPSCYQRVFPFCQFQNVLAVPENLSPQDIPILEQRITEGGAGRFILVRYRVKKDIEPLDSAVAQITAFMHQMEVDAVIGMASEGLLKNDTMLVVDGPLTFRKQFDVLQFRNVIGLSKSFRPNLKLGRSKKDVGLLTCGLSFGCRTSAFRLDHEDKRIGTWYLQLRNTDCVRSPLQGIVRIECYAVTPQEIEQGLDSARVSVISSHVFAERNVTPYGSDSRWASHLYPIYLAEQYLRSGFLSDTHFLALF